MITQAELLKLFIYRDGKLIWRVGKSHPTGKVAGCFSPDGSCMITIKESSYYSHRLIYLYHHGELPPEIDHIDGNRGNNKIENLRKCSRSENMFNTKKYRTNTSGVKGVYWHKHNKKWYARIRVKDKNVYEGRFTDLKEAEKEIKAARQRICGEFTNHG